MEIIGISLMPQLSRIHFVLNSQHKQPFVNPLATRLTAVKEIPLFVSRDSCEPITATVINPAQVERMVERPTNSTCHDECKVSGYIRHDCQDGSEEENPDRGGQDKKEKMKLKGEFELNR
jgi:hypothetical protein